MSPNIWGPPLWIFLHTISATISEEGYYAIGKQLFYFIVRIAKSLPCPDCSQHASDFLKNINPNSLVHKTDLVNMLYVFHNSVNKRKYKPLFYYPHMKYYERVSLIPAYNNFVSTYITNSSRLMNENLQRKMLVLEINKWIVKNIRYFIKPIALVETSTPEKVITENKDQRTTNNITAMEPTATETEDDTSGDVDADNKEDDDDEAVDDDEYESNSDL